MSFVKQHLTAASVCEPKTITGHDETSYAVNPSLRRIEKREEESVFDFLFKPLPEEKEDSFRCGNKKRLTISSFFEQNKIKICDNKSETVAPAVESLAFTIAINYPCTKEFIRFIRNRIASKNFEFEFNLSSFTPVEIASIIGFAECLSAEHKLISDYKHLKASGIISGKLSSSPKFINFINGDFAELYAKSVVVGVIKKAAAKYGADYEFYHNMLIEIDSEPHELDLVFRVGDKIFWGEIKTGDDFNPDEYRKRGIRMGFIPDRLIILSAKDNYETTASIAHFNDCFCGNVNSFKNELTKMIDKAFREELK